MISWREEVWKPEPNKKQNIDDKTKSTREEWTRKEGETKHENLSQND